MTFKLTSYCDRIKDMLRPDIHNSPRIFRIHFFSVLFVDATVKQHRGKKSMFFMRDLSLKCLHHENLRWSLLKKNGNFLQYKNILCIIMGYNFSKRYHFIFTDYLLRVMKKILYGVIARDLQSEWNIKCNTIWNFFDEKSKKSLISLRFLRR